MVSISYTVYTRCRIERFVGTAARDHSSRATRATAFVATITPDAACWRGLHLRTHAAEATPPLAGSPLASAALGGGALLFGRHERDRSLSAASSTGSGSGSTAGASSTDRGLNADVMYSTDEADALARLPKNEGSAAGAAVSSESAAAGAAVGSAFDRDSFSGNRCFFCGAAVESRSTALPSCASAAGASAVAVGAGLPKK